MLEDNAADTSDPKELIREIESTNDTGEKKKIHIAIAGCSHGEMDLIYDTLAEIEQQNGYKFDLLICCGDYQSVRNYGDLEQMHCPDKFKNLRTFYKYYNGEIIAPILTIFIGGNHEASGYLCELPNGGWVAPRIYYMGFSNVIRFAGLRIGGLSGIYKDYDFKRGHYERPPFTEKTITSIYHVRNLDIWRLKQLKPAGEDSAENHLDIMISHDWPTMIPQYGDVKKLLKEKPFFKDDIEREKLGNPATNDLLRKIRPRYWFAAHMHCMFPALVPHDEKNGKIPAPTRFLALNKPMPRRHFVQALEIEVDESSNTTELFYDDIWLAILRNTDKFTSASHEEFHMPSIHNHVRCEFYPTLEELAEVRKLGDLKIPANFKQTAVPCNGEKPKKRAIPSPYYRNAQSTHFCTWLGISDLNKMLADLDPSTLGTPYYILETSEVDPGQIDINDEDFGDEDFIIDTKPRSDVANPDNNFEAPEWKGNEQKEQTSDMPTLKRRRVDINEDE